MQRDQQYFGEGGAPVLGSGGVFGGVLPCIAVYRRVSAANSVYPRNFACFRCAGARPVYVQSVVDVRHPQLICCVPKFTARGPMHVLVCYGQKRRVLLDRLHASGVTKPA